MRRFFKDDDFDYLLQIALGSVYHRAADAGEVLATAERVRDGHPRSWTAEWTATADRLAGEAAASEAAGWPGIAARQFLRASLYYSVASYAADGTGDPAL
ncbi:MAG: dipeptidyl aminopeptidase, partial [Nocardiopsaceae bacterium]|nr:dipeptidyl aminopeptidase [Nocardiopsaceae bacterium]